MCGIAGSVSQKKTNSQKKQIKKMLLKMKYRGPDHLKISSSFDKRYLDEGMVFY